MSDRRIVITGMSVLNAAGDGLEPFWQSVAAGRNRLGAVTRFDTTGFPVRVAGEVQGFADDRVPPRLKRKSDRFTHYALATSAMAIVHAGLDLSEEDPDKIGVWFGNDTGGWDLAERGFDELYNLGAAMVNPYSATAWFPTAPQGFMTIAHRITGYSKSFVCDRATGGAALYFAWRAIRHGEVDVVLTGGAEAPVTALGLTCYFQTGELTRAATPDRAYVPFDRQASGLVMGEGSVVIVLEEAARAHARGAVIHGEVLGGAMTSDPDPTDFAGLELALRKALATAELSPQDVDLLFPEACANVDHDRRELATYRRAFADKDELLVTAPRAGYGHLFGASAGTDLVTGLLAARASRLPPTPNLREPVTAGNLRLVTAPEAAAVSRFVVSSRGREGVNTVMVIGTPG